MGDSLKIVIGREEDKKVDVVLKDSDEFLKWFLKEKPIDKEISFVGESPEISKMELLSEFLMYYFLVKKKCEKFMNNYNELFVLEDNNFLKEALDFFASSNKGGKFLRATLVSLGYNSFDKEDDDFLPLSMALEVFQTSILIHDDIIDEASKRRGDDTIPFKYKKVYSEPVFEKESFVLKRDKMADSMALCLGDIGLYFANQIIVKNYSNNLRLPLVLEYYNDIAIKTCKGEMIDVILPFFEEFYGQTENLEDNVFEIYKLKTAWYSVVGPYVLGAILAGADTEKINRLEDALINLGVSFQIKDDILGIYGDFAKTGKTSSDCAEFKQTILYAYAVNTSYKDDFLKMYGNDKNIDEVRDLFDKCGAKEYAIKLMDKLYEASFKEILNLDFLDFDKKKILLGFAEFLRVRSK